MEYKKKFLTCSVLLILLIWIFRSNIFLHFIGKTINSTRIFKTNISESIIEKIDYIEAIRKDCGQLCDTSRPGKSGQFFNQVTSEVDCAALFKNPFIDRGHGQPTAPKTIPNSLLSDFTMNGRVPVHKFYFNRPYLGKTAMNPVWSRNLIHSMISEAKQGKLRGTYGASETNALRDGLAHAPGIQNGRVLVIGSEKPWVEACALEAGAKEIVTLEYGRIISEHENVKALTPYDFRMKYINNTLGIFDAVVTFSSVEHSGLGRYGDALNPWGDIIAIARAWCVTRKGGSLTIGVMYNYDHDSIRFNADRIYGKIRYPYLTTNWKQAYRGNGNQRVHVFTK